MGPKTIIFNHGDKALNVSSFNLSRKNKQFKKEYQNRMKNDQFMPIRRSHAKVAVGLFWAILVTFYKISTSISGFLQSVCRLNSCNFGYN